MSLFLLIFLTIYGGMNAYALFRLARALDMGTTAVYYSAPLFIFMLFAPILVRILEKGGLESTATVLAWTAYTWMGVLFLFVSTSLLIEIYRILLYLFQLATGNNGARFFPSHKLSFYIPLTLSMVISIYGFFETNRIRQETVIIKTSKLPESVERIRVAQISDLHAGLLMKSDRLEKIASMIRDIDPDILVSTGDLVDGQSTGLDGTSRFLTPLKPKYGKYAVTGNHEFYAGLDYSLDFTEKSGFVVLRGAGATISGIINIAGVDDSTAGSMDLKKGMDESKLLDGLPGDRFTILLKHRPEIEADSLGLFDLQLSGHTHKGQIFPFFYAVRCFFPYIAGLYHLDKGSILYTSRGTGTWGPPMRFLSPPEITVIDIIRR